MPDLVGMSQELAESTIDTYKLGHGRVDPWFSDTVEKGLVITQYPLKDTPVEEGTEVNIQVSKGPDPDKQPPDLPPAVDPDPGMVTREEVIDLSSYSGTVDVRVLMDGVEVHRETVDTNMDVSVRVRVTGTGVRTLSIYINGTASGTQEVDFTQGSNVDG